MAETLQPAAQAAGPVQYLPAVQWYDVSDPNSPALDQLATRFRLHELQIEDCRHRPQRAKTEEHDRYVFSVLKHLHNNGDMVFDDLDIFLGSDYLITVHAGEHRFVEKVRQRAANDTSGRVDRLFYMIMDTVVDEYIPMLDGFADEISDIEAIVLECPDEKILARILNNRRKLIEFRRIAGGMRDVVNILVRREGGMLGDDLDPYLRDIYDHLVRTVELIEMQQNLLVGAMEIYLSSVANRTNQIMKVLTLWGTIALPFVVVTGFFGMNLNLPWSDHPLGALFAAGVMLAVGVFVLLYFRRKGWI